ncbi:MAG: response regulator [Bacteroidota bacterium]|jgi:hypothetical protein
MANKYKNNPILLIEDNPIDVDLTLRAFKKRNLVNPILVARDGATAIEYINKWDSGDAIPLVILLDLKLPKVDGLEVLKTFKNHPVYKTIPIVVLTSSSDNKDIEKAYKSGANSYIIKPVNFDKFVDVASQIELYWNILNEPIL